MNIERFLTMNKDLPATLSFSQYKEIMMMIQQHFEVEYGWDKEEFYELYPTDEYMEEINLYYTELPDIPTVNATATLNISTRSITQVLSGENIPTLQYKRTFKDYDELIEYIKVSEGHDFIIFPPSQKEEVHQTLLQAIQVTHDISTIEEGLSILGYRL